MKLTPLGNVHIDELLDRTIRVGCRELHLRSGQSPLTRACRDTAGGGLLPYEALNPLDLMQIVYAILTDEQIWQLERERKLSFSYSLARRAKFDGHIDISKNAVEADFVAAPPAMSPGR